MIKKSTAIVLTRSVEETGFETVWGANFGATCAGVLTSEISSRENVCRELVPEKVAVFFFLELTEEKES